jgi:hypothetical protein
MPSTNLDALSKSLVAFQEKDRDRAQWLSSRQVNEPGPTPRN